MTTSETVIEMARPKHWQELQTISRQTFIDTYQPMNEVRSVEQYVQKNFNDQAVQKQLADINSQFFLARRLGNGGDELVGYLKLNQGDAQTEQVLEGALEIERIYATRAAIGTGIGKLLCDHSINVARALNKKWIWLGVWERNDKAISFYTKAGFEKFSTHGFQFGEEIHTDWMMRRAV